MIVNLFYTVLEISLSVSAAVLLVFLFMPLLKKRFAAKWRYWIWLLLAVRLVIPINYHVQQPAIQFQVPQRTIVAQAAPSAPAGVSPSSEQQVQQPVQSQQPVTVADLLATVWVAGIVLFLIYRFSGYFIFLHEIRRWSRPVDDSDTIAILKTEMSEMEVRRTISFLFCKKISSPMMTGFFRPMLLLPETDYAADDLRLILKHELIHLKRGDIWYKLFLSSANAIHWFNPVIWLMVRKASEDTELVCDMEVVQGQGEDYRKHYGETILSAVRKSTICRTVFSTYFYGGVKAMKQRIFNIFDTGKKHRGITAFCITILAALAIGTCVACGDAGPKLLSQINGAAGTSSKDNSSQDSSTLSSQNQTSSSATNSASSSEDTYPGINVTSKDVSTDFGGTVLYGSLKSDPQQGVAVVIWNGHTTGQLFLTPGKHGAIRALGGKSAKDDVFSVVAADGYEWIFNMYNGFAEGRQRNSSTVSKASSNSAASPSVNTQSGGNWVVYSNGKESQINGDWIIYDSYIDAYKLHKVKRDGSNDTVLVNSHVQTPCMAGQWIYYFKDLSEIDKVKFDGTQNQKVCGTDAFQNLDGSTATSAMYQDGYILYKLNQLVPVGDVRSVKPVYYKFDLTNNKITQVKYSG